MTIESTTDDGSAPLHCVVGRIKSLFHTHRFDNILGHTINDKIPYSFVRLHFKCKCGKKKSVRYKPNHPMVDAEAKPQFMCSGYSWWLFEALQPNHEGHRAALRGSDAPAGSTAGNKDSQP